MNNRITSPALWLLFLLISFPQLSETVYAPALPNITSTLSTSSHLVQWTLSLYFCGFALGVFFWGRLSDHIGRRYSMIIGISIYIFGCVFCLCSHNIIELLCARFVQGFGASAGSVLTQAIARESLQGHKRHTFFSAGGAILALAISAGPLIGGYLTQWFDWQANFTFLIGVGFVLIILAAIFLPETHIHRTKHKNKISQVALMLLKDKYVLGCAWLVAAVNGILFSYYAESPFIFINLLHLKESQYGWLGLIIALAAFLGSFTAKYLMKNINPEKTVLIGCCVMIISSLLLLLISIGGLINPQNMWESVTFIMVPMMGIVLGSFGFIIPVCLSTALLKYQSVLGTAGALFGLTYYILIAIITWGMGLIHNGTDLPMPVYFLILSILSFIVFWASIRKKRLKP